MKGLSEGEKLIWKKRAYCKERDKDSSFLTKKERNI